MSCARTLTDFRHVLCIASTSPIMTNPMPETSVIPTFHKLRTCRSLVFDTQEQLFRLENPERRVALGRVIRLGCG